MPKSSKETTVHDLPLDVFKELFSRMDYATTKCFRIVCRTLDNVYRFHRSSIVGPTCNVRLQSYEGVISLWTRDSNYKYAPKLVPLDSWPCFFRNATVIKLSINVDECISSHLIRQLLCCRSVENIEYSGDAIDRTWIDALGSLVTGYLDVSVRNWTTDIGDISKKVRIRLTENVQSFESIMKLMISTQTLIWSMDWEIFSNNSHYFDKFDKAEFDIECWTINITNVPEETDVDSKCQQFVAKIQKSSKHRIMHIVEDDLISYEMRMYRE